MNPRTTDEIIDAAIANLEEIIKNEIESKK